MLITNYPDSSSCDIINQINFHEEQHLIKEDNKWSKKQEPIGDIYDDVMMMTNSLQKEVCLIGWKFGSHVVNSITHFD